MRAFHSENEVMKTKLLYYMGMPLVLLGVLLLVIECVFSLTNSNLMLVIPLLLIVIGIVCYVLNIKKNSRY